jgi:integrase
MKLEKIKARGAQNLYRRPETGTIYYRQEKKGRGEVCRSLKTESLEIAKARAEEIRREFLLQVPRKPMKFLTALEIFDSWLERREAHNLRYGTIVSIRNTRKNLKRYLKDMFLDDITAQWWESIFLPEMRQQNEQRRFFNDRKWLLSFLRQMKEDGVIDKIPVLINPDPRGSPGKVFSDEEVRDLIDCSCGDMRLAIVMAATMGMRRGEIYGLEWSRVDLDRRVIRLLDEHTKTKQGRAFGISSTAYDMLLERKKGPRWVFARGDSLDQPIHPDALKSVWTNLKADLGITGRFHDLRHTFLTKAFKAPGANTALICFFAGLSLQVAEARYLHFTEEDSRHIAELVEYPGRIRKGMS